MAYRKIAQEKIDKILELAEKGLPREEIAEELGVSGGTVSKYISKSIRPRRKPAEGSFSEVLALLEETLTLLQEQRQIKTVLCPMCRFPLQSDLNGNDILWACPKCGYRGVSPEPEWREIQDFKIKEI
jgi:predicted transcriptional regulator